MGIPAPTVTLVGLAIGFTGGASRFWGWELLSGFFQTASVPFSSSTPEPCVCVCDCWTSSPAPSPWFIGFAYSVRQDGYWAGVLSGLLIVSLVLAVACVVDLVCRRRSSRQVRGGGKKEGLLQVTVAVADDGASSDRASGSLGSPPKTRRRGGGVLVRANARP